MIHGVVFLIFRGNRVLMERCPKKRIVLGVGEWFLPGGKIELGESPEQTLEREVREELGVTILTSRPLPIVEGSRVPAGERGIFLMRPFVIGVAGNIPSSTLDGDVELRWEHIADALHSPVPQVRMMVAAAIP